MKDFKEFASLKIQQSLKIAKIDKLYLYFNNVYTKTKET